MTQTLRIECYLFTTDSMKPIFRKESYSPEPYGVLSERGQVSLASDRYPDLDWSMANTTNRIAAWFLRYYIVVLAQLHNDHVSIPLEAFLDLELTLKSANRFVCAMLAELLLTNDV
ncbi:hypothetical protein NPIL_168001 [Nephila pilipes]|uniref:Uncharacterized protein n=1 Tax=Nephila pilipes TaxID=299642 RepID=A0A8X6MTU8_NEPPI|nr:hypothetical protein NPIL_168001 [Nephila pilipes]